MLDHPIVDVALGRILLYTVLSLFASVAKEWISTLLALRAKNLEKGIRTLIGADYASKLYKQPLVSTLATGKKLPSYIGSGTICLFRRSRPPVPGEAVHPFRAMPSGVERWSGSSAGHGWIRCGWGWWVSPWLSRKTASSSRP